MPSRKTGRANAAKIEHRRAVNRRRSQQVRWEQLKQLAAEQRRKRRKKIAIGSAAVVVIAAVTLIVTLTVRPHPENRTRTEFVAPTATTTRNMLDI